jgi:hypothetical protein
MVNLQGVLLSCFLSLLLKMLQCFNILARHDPLRLAQTTIYQPIRGLLRTGMLKEEQEALPEVWARKDAGAF